MYLRGVSLPTVLDKVTVRVPASVANLGAAFDCLAMAICVHAEVSLERAPSPRVAVTGAAVPQDATNLIYRSASAVAALAGYRGAFDLKARFHIPLCAGLGSSAAAIVGGSVAAARLLGAPLSPDALLRVAAGLEGHPDNVAAALLGGVVVVAQNGAGLRWARITPALPLAIVLAVPDLQTDTAASRRILPQHVSRRDAVHNLGHAMLLVAALVQGRGDLLGDALSDRLHQQYRTPLVPGFDQVVAAAKAAGAYGAVLSGSGPSVAALTPPDAAARVGEAMVQAFRWAGVYGRAVLTEVDPCGAISSAVDSRRR